MTLKNREEESDGLHQWPDREDICKKGGADMDGLRKKLKRTK